MIKSCLIHKSHIGRNLDGFQLLTAIERIPTDGLQGRGQTDRCQIDALIECRYFNTGNALLNFHAGDHRIIGTPGNLTTHGTVTADGQGAVTHQYPGQVAPAALSYDAKRLIFLFFHLRHIGFPYNGCTIGAVEDFIRPGGVTCGVVSRDRTLAVIEGIKFNKRCIAFKYDFRQLRRTIERTITNIGYLLRNRNGGQTTTTGEAFETDANQAIWEHHICKGFAAAKCILTNTGQAIFHHHISQLITGSEGIVTKTQHTSRDLNGSQIITVQERTEFDCSNRIRDGNIGQTRTSFKSCGANRHNTIRNFIAAGDISGAENQFGLILVKQNTRSIAGVIFIFPVHPDTSQGCAFTERILTDRGHAGSNIDGFQRLTVIERIRTDGL